MPGHPRVPFGRHVGSQLLLWLGAFFAMAALLLLVRLWTTVRAEAWLAAGQAALMIGGAIAAAVGCWHWSVRVERPTDADDSRDRARSGVSPLPAGDDDFTTLLAETELLHATVEHERRRRRMRLLVLLVLTAAIVMLNVWMLSR